MTRAIVFIGHAGHGKSTAARMLADCTGWYYIGPTSRCAAPDVFERLAPRYGYRTVEECWRDRGNHRIEWADIIAEINGDDGVGLYRRALDAADGPLAIMDGIRRPEELAALRREGLVAAVVWVDASPRVPKNDPTCRLDAGFADFVVRNDKGTEELRDRLQRLVSRLAGNAS